MTTYQGTHAIAGSTEKVMKVTGMGSELALACDMRFAGREKAILSQFEVGAGLVPGGGPMARLQPPDGDTVKNQIWTIKLTLERDQ